MNNLSVEFEVLMGKKFKFSFILVTCALPTRQIASNIQGYQAAFNNQCPLYGSIPDHRPSQGGPWPPKFLENIVILCFESRFSKQNSVIRLKSNIFPPEISRLATRLSQTCRASNQSVWSRGHFHRHAATLIASAFEIKRSWMNSKKDIPPSFARAQTSAFHPAPTFPVISGSL